MIKIFWKIKRHFFLLAGIFYCFAVASIYPENLTVLYTGSLRGNLSGCECTAKPNSGLIRRFFAISKMKSADPGLILLDTGDMLGYKDAEEKAAYILKTFLRQGYDAIVPGYQDITHSTGVVQKKRMGIPYLGIAKVPKIKKSMLVNRTGFNIGIIGYISPKTFRFSSKNPSDYGLVYDLNYVTEEARALRQNGADFVILLAHCPRSVAIDLSQINVIDIVIAGNDQFQPEKPDDSVIQNRYVLSAGGDDGEYIGRITLEKKNGKVSVFKNELLAVHDLNPSRDEEIKEWLKKHPEYEGR